MKCIYAFAVLLLTIPLRAQNSGCDGSRFKSEVFANVKRTTVTYAQTVSHLNSLINLAMDVYEPEGDTLSKRPAIVMAHGGSFILGNKNDIRNECELLARRGYVVASIQYRLFPFLALGFPDSVKIMDTAVKAVGDMRAATRFLRMDAATANQFRIDPDHIFVGGYSAGAVTALHYAYLQLDDDIPGFLANLIEQNRGINLSAQHQTALFGNLNPADYSGLEGISGSPENKTYSSRADAVINLSGGIYRSAWLQAGEPPLTSIHGTADETVDYNFGLAANIAYLEGSNLIRQRAEAVGLRNFLQTVPDGGHTNIYSGAAYAAYRDTFWTMTSALLEDLSCTPSVSIAEPGDTGAAFWSFAPNPASDPYITLDLSAIGRPVDLLAYDVQGRLLAHYRQIAHGQKVELPAGASGSIWLLPQAANLRFEAKQLAVPK
ncbi:MAG: alpha/beta hydrolase [Saprospiraceae bacterium]